ncbi:MAG: hypothetical protein R3F59_15205 [Myxococcota bacterium]
MRRAVRDPHAQHLVAVVEERGHCALEVAGDGDAAAQARHHGGVLAVAGAGRERAGLRNRNAPSMAHHQARESRPEAGDAGGEGVGLAVGAVGEGVEAGGAALEARHVEAVGVEHHQQAQRADLQAAVAGAAAAAGQRLRGLPGSA